jgi:hypothetical protein
LLSHSNGYIYSKQIEFRYLSHTRRSEHKCLNVREIVHLHSGFIRSPIRTLLGADTSHASNHHASYHFLSFLWRGNEDSLKEGLR